MNSDSTDDTFKQELEKQFPSARSPSERQSLLELTRGLTRLPLNTSSAVLETAASIAGISLRAAIEFLRAAPPAAEILDVTELRAWGEMGRRLAMGDAKLQSRFTSPESMTFNRCHALRTHFCFKSARDN